jgi:hypothetical protein
MQLCCQLMAPTAPVDSRDDAVVDAIRRQAASSRTIGSPLYGSLLDGLAGDYLAGGVTFELLHGISDRPTHDAVPLRYLATAHRLALTGRAPGLAAAYDSCGGSWGGQDLTETFLRTVHEHRDEFIAGLRRNVQTNEVARSAVLASGFSLIIRRHRLPLALFEVGSSAGLLSRWMHYRFDTGTTARGPTNSPLTFDGSWWRTPPPRLDPTINVAAVHASDIAPIDLTSQAGREQMLSFLWPDQRDRRERLQAALAVAAEHPLTVEQADAAEWVAGQLSAGLAARTATVVFHAIVWQYLPAATRDGMRDSLRRAGATASTTSPLLWLRMEPDTHEHAALRLTTWPGDTDEVLAHVGYHGADIVWLLDTD